MTRGSCEVPDGSAWAKLRGLDPSLPPYPLVRHLLDAAAMALCLWDRYLSDSQRRCIADGLGLADDLERARALVGLCAGLHDIGKLSGFQFCDVRGREHLSEELARDPGKAGVEKVAHDVAGMVAAPAVLAALGFDDGMTERGAIDRVAEIIGAPPARAGTTAPSTGRHPVPVVHPRLRRDHDYALHVARNGRRDNAPRSSSCNTGSPARVEPTP